MFIEIRLNLILAHLFLAQGREPPRARFTRPARLIERPVVERIGNGFLQTHSIARLPRFLGLRGGQDVNTSRAPACRGAPTA